MNRSIIPSVLLASIVAAAGGCATIFAPGPDEVEVNSLPDGAMVMLDGVPVGETPTVIPIPRASEGILTLELFGHEPGRVDLDKNLNYVTLVNLAFGPFFIVPMAVDVVSGNIVKYPEAPIHVTLTPRHGREEPPPEEGAVRPGG